jgi:seryl-tRNA synthetase
MLDIKWIRENPDALDGALKNRGAAPESARLIALDEARRTAIGKLEEAQARRNAASKDIGKAKAQKDEATAQKLMAEVAALKDAFPAMEEAVRQGDKALEDALAIVPNVPLDNVPVGADEHANVEYRRWGSRPAINDAKEHFDIGEALGGMDFETAAKLSGSRFVVLKGQVARLERALGQFMLDLHTTDHGYREVRPPALVRDETLFGTAQLPKFAVDLFRTSRSVESFASFDDIMRSTVTKTLQGWGEIQQGFLEKTGKTFSFEDGLKSLNEVLLANMPSYRAEYEAARADALRLWLIPTAEVPLTNLVRESIVEEKELPLRVTALTPCFRAEAGAAGRDTRGMLRQHQFDKVELVSITTPEQSVEEHERMLVCAEEVLKRLDLHYRVMTLSTGDMGFASQKTYDIEVWLPGQGTYREISSCSVCGDFQARRMNARFRPKEGKGNRLVHTLNGSGVAVGRALIAVLENYQNPDGSVAVPDALRPYMGGLERIGKSE